jgi:hypothetical protein
MKATIPELELVSQVIQEISEGLPKVTAHDVRVLMSIDQFLDIKTGEKSLGPISDDLQKLYTFLVYKYDNIMNKERGGEIVSQEDREFYLMSRIAWGIFWCEVKREKTETELDGGGCGISFRKGFTAVIQEKAPVNMFPFTGDYNPEPALDPEDEIEIDPKNILPFPGIHASGED